jgi:hypothetical protein
MRRVHVAHLETGALEQAKQTLALVPEAKRNESAVAAARASGESVGASSTNRATSSSGVSGAAPTFTSLRAAERTPSQAGKRSASESR